MMIQFLYPKDCISVQDGNLGRINAFGQGAGRGVCRWAWSMAECGPPPPNWCLIRWLLCLCSARDISILPFFVSQYRPHHLLVFADSSSPKQEHRRLGEERHRDTFPHFLLALGLLLRRCFPQTTVSLGSSGSTGNIVAPQLGEF